MAKHLVTTVVNFKHQYLVETDDPDKVIPIWTAKSSPDNILHWDFIGENIVDTRLIQSEEEYNDILDEADEGESADEMTMTDKDMKFGDDGESDIEDDSDFSSLEHDIKKDKNNVN